MKEQFVEKRFLQEKRDLIELCDDVLAEYEEDGWIWRRAGWSSRGKKDSNEHIEGN